MRKLEPALIAVPNSLMVTVILESLSITVEYLEENLLGEITNRHTGRPLIGVAISTLKQLAECVWKA
jgi:hypothetical protein